ncbi:MAG: hypothetical protein P4M05_26145 [Bradyrhizobium sp.]|nr:hypothetical protein [Bradyrhizobium sp.]
MTALGSLNALTDPTLAAGLQRQRTPASYQAIARMAGPTTVAAFSSGYAEFDRILDRLHTAFGQLAQVDDAGDDAADATDDLSTSLQSLTGRSTAQGVSDPASLAAEMQKSLAVRGQPLSDPTAQALLRAL